MSASPPVPCPDSSPGVSMISRSGMVARATLGYTDGATRFLGNVRVGGRSMARNGRTAVLAPPLDAESVVPLHRQLYDGVRQLILHGNLAAGARLPSTRTLAQDLGVSP